MSSVVSQISKLTPYVKRVANGMRQRGASAATSGARVVVVQPPLPLPDGVSEAALKRWMSTISVDGAPASELRGYLEEDFKRFVYTLGLVRGLTGQCLEIGGNPYFSTMLLKQFTSLDVRCTNYFGSHVEAVSAQTVRCDAFPDGASAETVIEFDHFNVELVAFPYADSSFDVVLLCEVIEHLIEDPVRVLREVRRVLKPNGTLILTTPNVAAPRKRSAPCFGCEYLRSLQWIWRLWASQPRVQSARIGEAAQLRWVRDRRDVLS